MTFADQLANAVDVLGEVNTLIQPYQVWIVTGFLATGITALIAGLRRSARG